MLLTRQSLTKRFPRSGNETLRLHWFFFLDARLDKDVSRSGNETLHTRRRICMCFTNGLPRSGNEMLIAIVDFFLELILKNKFPRSGNETNMRNLGANNCLA